MASVVTVATPELGDRSYLVHDGRLALVVDPQRDLERILGAAEEAGVEIAAVAETHLHNDYLSGGLELARSTGAEYLVAAAEEVAFERRPIAPGGTFEVGELRVEAVATPGHTPHHLAFVVRAGGSTLALTGGSLLLGTVGRTDLVGASRAEELARAQFRSVRDLAAGLPDEALVLPTHGFGSFCSATPSSGDGPTLGEQRATNPVLGPSEEDRYVEALLAGLTAFPSYYARMGPVNRRGAPPLPPPPPLLEPVELPRLLEAAWVVDLRHRRAFASAHLAGTVSFELAQPFTTYLGWVVPSEVEVVLLGAAGAELDEASRALARIGLLPAGGLLGTTEELAGASGVPLERYPSATFADLAAAWASSPPELLDVRRPEEWAAGHLLGSTNVFVAELPGRLGELPEGTLWVHCASGYRAGVAASILAWAGREVVLVDDEWANALEAGLPVVG